MDKKMIKKWNIGIILVIFAIISWHSTIYGYNINYNDLEFEYSESGKEVIIEPEKPSTPNPNIDGAVELIQTNNLRGKISEVVEAIDKQELGSKDKDSSNNAYTVGIEGIPVKLNINGKNMTTTTTEDGNYSFNVSDFSQGKYKYTLQYMYPGVNKNSISGISTVEQAKKLQKILKYNSQDYISTDEIHATTIEKKGIGAAEIFLLLDYSASMEEEIVVNGETTTKLELEKKFASKLVNTLITEDSNIYMGLIIFRGEARKMVSLTDNKETLLRGINESTGKDINFTAYTNIISALNKATQSNNIGFTDNANKFIFLLSDGIPTWDGDKNNYLYNTKVGNAAEIEKANDRKLDKIINNTKKKIEELEKSGITIYSIIAKSDIIDDNLKEKLKDIYQYNKDSKYNKYKEINDMSELNNLKSYIQDFRQYVKSTVKVTETEYQINQNLRNKKIPQEYGEFNYKNTLPYEALDMNINQENLELFKQYAIEIVDKTQVVCEQTGEVEIWRETEPVNNPDKIKYKIVSRDENIKNVYLERIQTYTLKPTLTVTNMKVITVNGSIFINEETSANTYEDRIKDLYSVINNEEVYGSTVMLEYTVGAINVSCYKDTNNVKLIFYLPDTFTYERGHGVTAKGIYLNNQEIPLPLLRDPIEVDSSNVEILKNNNEVSNELAEYIKKGHRALIMMINTNANNFKLLTNGQVQAKVYVSKILSNEEDDMTYNSDAEIVGYSNSSFRRLQYETVFNNGLDGAVASNYDTNEQDFVHSNDAILTAPTGENKSMIGVMIIITILILNVIVLRIMYRKK